MYCVEGTRCIINLREIIQNFLILKWMLHDCVVTTVLETVRQNATLIKTNFGTEHIALALSPVNLHSVYPNSIQPFCSIDFKDIPKETD